MSIDMKNAHTLSLALGLVLGMGTAHAALVQTLLDEDFQDVTGLTAAATIRTVQDILTNSPGQLPAGTLRSFTGDASESSFNVRRGDNAIDGNTGTAALGNLNFDNFFGDSTNRFLVIGDDAGGLANDPNGPATMILSFPLATVTLPHVTYLNVAFDYVFDTNNTAGANSDDFLVRLILADNSTVNLLEHLAPAVSTRGSFSTTLNWSSLQAKPSYLSVRLIEYAGGNSSAVGLDNIKVTAIPEPGMLGLLGLGLLALGLARRRG